MVAAAIPTTPRTPNRPPLISSEKNNSNNADPIQRKLKHKEITSRYLPSSSSIQPKTPSPLPQPPLPKRPQSTNRARRQITPPESPRIMSSTTTRSLAVSFQGESFSFQTTKPKPVAHNPPPKKPKSVANALAAKARQPNSMTRSLDCTMEQKGPILAAVRVLGHSVLFNEKVKRATFYGEELYLSSDTDSLSSGSNSSSKDRAIARGISVPARFWPENSSPVKKSVVLDAQLHSSRMHSTNKVENPHLRRMATTSVKDQQRNVASVMSFSAEARRAKRAEGRVEEAHTLRLLYNRYLQWRCVNAQSDAALSAQRVNSERALSGAWITISELREAVINKRIKLQLLLQNLKLTSIFKGQMNYLEDWSLKDSEHHNYISGLTEALRASTLRLPIVNGARVHIPELQNAVDSAVLVMQATGTSVCSLLSKVQGMTSVMSELTKTAAQEQALLQESKDLLSTVAMLHVKQCSLRGQIIQLNHKCNMVHQFNGTRGHLVTIMSQKSMVYQ